MIVTLLVAFLVVFGIASVAGVRVPFFGPTLYFGKIAFWEVPREHWDTYMAEMDRSRVRGVIALFGVASFFAAMIWLANR